MSHRRQSKQPVRRVQSGSRSLRAEAPNAAGQDRYAGTNDQDDVDYADDGDYDEYEVLSDQGDEYDYEEQYQEPLPVPRGRAAREVGADVGAYGRRAGSTAPSTRRYAVAQRPPRRDYFPYVMGGLIGALVVGLMAVAYLLGTSGRPAGPTSSGQGGQGGQGLPTAPAAAAGVQGGQAASEPPRISMAEFKALYDDPAKRPMIIDVRTKQAYDEGHIKGAVSFPEADADARFAELPKDTLVVAYCQ